MKRHFDLAVRFAALTGYFAIAGLLFAVLQFAGAIDGAAQTRAPADMSKTGNPELIRRQRQFVSDLRRRAREISGEDETSDAYWAALRRLLKNQQQTRGPAAQSRAPRTRAGRSGQNLPTGEQRNAHDAGAALNFETPDISESEISALEERLRKFEAGTQIVGGTAARPGEFPEVVSIAKFTPIANGAPLFSSFCSGTHLGDGHILTAAHCICGEESAFAKEQVAVVFGTDARQSETITNAFSVRNDLTSFVVGDPQRVCQSYRRDGEQILYGRDLALIRFNTSAVGRLVGDTSIERLPTAKIADISMFFGFPTPLAEGGQPTPLELALVGFGYTADPSTNLHTAELGKKHHVTTLVADAICDSADRYGCQPGREVVVIDSYFERDSCNGDSGGPAFLVEPSHGAFLIAVTSRGVATDGKCGAGGIYGLLNRRALSWIEAKVVNVTTCTRPERCARRGN